MPATATPSTTITRIGVITDDELLYDLKALLSLDFADHDSRLRQCIDAARDDIEDFTGLLLTPATVTVSYAALYDYERLKGPVTGTVTITDLLNVPILGIAIESGPFPVLRGDYPKGIALSYTAGYEPEDVPASLNEAMLNLAANFFDGLERDWQKPARRKQRITWAD